MRSHCSCPLVFDWSWREAAYQALALLVIACPCALVLSTPVTVVSALTAAARRGILIKGGSALEQARSVRAIALDKASTLTTGSPKLMQVQAWESSPSVGADSVAWQLASRSDHPVSRAIAAGLAQSLPPGQTSSAEELTALPGRGVAAAVQGKHHVLGNLRLIREMGLASDSLEEALAVHSRAAVSLCWLTTALSVRFTPSPTRCASERAKPSPGSKGAGHHAAGPQRRQSADREHDRGRSGHEERLRATPEDKLRRMGELRPGLGPWP